jgi:hypothetical protein
MSTTPLFSHILEPSLNKKFFALCEDADGALALRLYREVDEHVDNVRLALKSNEFLDVVIVEKIAGILKNLLVKIETYSKEKQRLIVGAARYFVKSNDAQADLGSLLGFDDDVEVLNYVLAELGHNDMRIQH